MRQRMPGLKWLFLTSQTVHGRSERFSRHVAPTADGRSGTNVTNGSTRASLDVPIGVDIGAQGHCLGLTPHEQWHWGPETRWTHWAPLGGIGLISRRHLEVRPRRLGPKTG